MPTIQMRRRRRLLVILGTILPVLFLCLPAAISVWAERELRDSIGSVGHTMEVERLIQRVHSTILAAQSGQRGFLLTDQATFLETYRTANEELPHLVDSLATMTSDNAVQVRNMEYFGKLILTARAAMAKTIVLQEAGNHAEAKAIVASNETKIRLDTIRTVLRDMSAEEAVLLTRRHDALEFRARLARNVLWGLVLVTAGFVATILLLLRRLSKANTLVKICAWSQTIEYQGEWISFDRYLARRFGIDTTHGISPDEAEKLSAACNICR